MHYFIRKTCKSALILNGRHWPLSMFFNHRNKLKSNLKNRNTYCCFLYYCRTAGYFKKKNKYKLDKLKLLINDILPSHNNRAEAYPVFICFSRKPNHYRFRLMQLLMNYKDSFIRVGRPYNIETKDIKALLEIRTLSLSSIKKMEIATKGKKQLKRSDVAKILMKEEAVQNLIKKRDYHKNIKAAEKIFKEMIADYSLNFIKLFNVILTPLFSYLYNDFIINHDVLEEIRHLASDHPVIYIPNHKSHMDYLLISFWLFKNHLLCPLIAAGDNLNYFPLGLIFRKAGAFFIKRDFKEDLLYPQLFKQYLSFLLKNNSGIEFFIEGTRTRSGKLLSPKGGLLRIIIQGARELKLKDLYIVPISIEYDRVIEDSVVTDEDIGIPKKKEDIEGLFDIHNFIKKHYNNVYIHFSKPVSINSFLHDNLKAKDNRYTKKRFQELSAYIMKNIHDNMDISATTLLSAALFYETGWTSIEEIRWRTKLLLNTIKSNRSKKVSSVLINKDTEELIDKHLEFLISQDFLVKSSINGHQLYRVPSTKQNLLLKYYFNSISDILLPRGLLYYIVKKHKTTAINTILPIFDDLKQVFRHNINFDRHPGPHYVSEILKELAEIEDIRQKHKTVHFWQCLCTHIRESYCSFINIIINLLDEGNVLEQKKTLDKIIKACKFYHRTGIIKNFNSISVEIFSNIFDYLIEENILMIVKNNDDSKLRTIRLNHDNIDIALAIVDKLSYDHEKEQNLWIDKADLYG